MVVVYPAAQPKAAFILAHGAGAGQKSPFMVRFAKGMADRGITTATFDFAYIEAKKSVPDRAPVLEQRWRDVLEEARAKKEFKGLRIAIGGKSMGGRIASHIASQGVEGVSALVFLGYPLHPPGKPDQRREDARRATRLRDSCVGGAKRRPAPRWLCKPASTPPRLHRLECQVN